MPTKCSAESEGRRCSCAPGHRWREDVCESDGCCESEDCIVKTSSAPVCIPETTVGVTGSIEVNTSDKKSIDLLLTEMKKVFSTITGFDTLELPEPRANSIIDLNMTLPFGVSPEELFKKTQYVADNYLNGSWDLKTTGLVHLDAPSNLVCYNTKVRLNCSSQVKTETDPQWFLRNAHDRILVNTGTIVTVTSKGNETEVTFAGVSAFWRGEFTCDYQQKSNAITISHISSKHVDVAILPNIDIFTKTKFPSCEKKPHVEITVTCEIMNTTDQYNVTWTGGKVSQSSLTEKENRKIYTATIHVRCEQGDKTRSLGCVFRNRCNQERNASVDIHLMYDGDLRCAAVDDWPATKAGFTAQLKCVGKVGLRERECSQMGIWGEQMAACVDFELNTLVNSALDVDSGFGLLEKNAGDVFSSLKNFTGSKTRINSFANVKTSVEVLAILGTKLLSITSETAADDLLETSSVLLGADLEKSWKPTTVEEGQSLPERYLHSFEQLIDRVNATQKKEKQNLEVSTCNATEICKSSVFDLNVTLNSAGKGRVKTIGFRQLASYFPRNENEDFEPNSILVSVTTTEENMRHVNITLDFPLLHPRRRNFELRCVFWDNRSRQWSTDGCEWGGPSDVARCTCKHLSSFAILVSKYPVVVKFSSEITYAGLSISVASLIFTLVIEAVIWKDVIRTNTLYFRHITNVNISLCLLVADGCFLASSKPRRISESWCKTLTVLKHYFYLSMFFWMLSLSCTVLHHTVFVFHTMRKKHYLLFSIVLGYVCPLIIVLVSYVVHEQGAEDVYFSKDTCWLVYVALMKGSFYTFIVPVGVIVLINNFCMVFVILKLLSNTRGASCENEKMALKTVVRTVVVLSPVFGVTWIFGFAVMLLDVTSGPIARAIQLVFVVLNSLQGFFLLLTTCLWDQMSREALMSHLKKKGFKGFYSTTTIPRTTLKLSSITESSSPSCTR
ncbi:unnamed protein product [Ophioblennius macclurei]